MADIIKDFIHSNLQLRNCRGQASDSMSSMSGRLNGVAARLREEETKAFYGSLVKPVFANCGQKCHAVGDALALTTEVGNLIR